MRMATLGLLPNAVKMVRSSNIVSMLMSTRSTYWMLSDDYSFMGSIPR